MDCKSTSSVRATPLFHNCNCNYSDPQQKHHSFTHYAGCMAASERQRHDAPCRLRRVCVHV